MTTVETRLGHRLSKCTCERRPNRKSTDTEFIAMSADCFLHKEARQIVEAQIEGERRRDKPIRARVASALLAAEVAHGGIRTVLDEDVTRAVALADQLIKALKETP